MPSFRDLKANRQRQAEALQKRLDEQNSGGGGYQDKDDRYWYPAVDKAGNGYAVIRFLPPPGDEEMPFVRLWSHGFKGPSGKWYIENSLTTLGKNDPVGELNSSLWNSGTDDGKKQASKQKRRLGFIANVYIVKDKQNPENEGQVRLFKFGKKLFDKLNDAMNPKFEDDKPMNPFDLWEGANFKIKIVTEGEFRNYDASEFDSPGPLASDEEMEKIWNQAHSLAAEIGPDKFKTYEELKAKLDAVMASASAPPTEARAAKEPVDSRPKREEALPESKDEDDDDVKMFEDMLK